MQAIAENGVEGERIDRMPHVRSPAHIRPQESKVEDKERQFLPHMHGNNGDPYDSPAARKSMDGKELWGMVKKSVQDRSFFEAIKTELAHLPTVLQKSLTYGHHTMESMKMKRQNSKLWDTALPVTKASVYYGPGVTPCAWSAWDRSIGENHLRVKYVIFRNRRWGTTVEFDVQSSGAIRYASNDHSKPIFVQRNGLQNPAATFGAGRLVHDLKNKARPGSLAMNAAEEMYGGWVAKVKGSKIVVTHSSGMNPSERLHIVFTPESFIFLGEVSSVSNQPMCFKVDVGKNSAPLDRKASDEVKSKLEPTSTESDSDEDDFPGVDGRGVLQHRDALGSLRRALTSFTSAQRSNEAAADEYLRLPVAVRVATIAEAELKDLLMQKALGYISMEEYEQRASAVQRAPLFPSEILTRENALDASMFVDPETERHLPAEAFHGFQKLSWKQRLKAAKEVQAKMSDGQCKPRSQQPLILRQHSFDVKKETTESEPVDPEDLPPPDLKQNTQYIELMAGIRSFGVKREAKAVLDRIQKEYAAYRGKEVRQLYEECMRCGRPGEVQGSGLCGLCVQLERERLDMGITESTTDPATYLGDSRALRGFDGFEQYVDVPLQKDRVFLNKRSDSFVSTPLDKHRQRLSDLGDLPITPMPQEWSQHRGEEHAGEENLPSPAHDEPPPLEAMTAKEFLRLVRNNKYHQVYETLMGDLRYAHERDREGNTALLLAGQQGYKKMSQLLLHANSDINAQNKHGNTVLHFCSRYGFHQLWNYFKKKGADDSLTNDHGLTCYEIELPRP